MPVQLPSSTVSTSPTSGVPEMIGSSVFAGAPLDWTTSVAAERAFAAPSAFTAVTRTRIERPASACTSV